MNYSDHNFIEITHNKLSCDSLSLCTGSTHRTCWVESCQVEPCGIWAYTTLVSTEASVIWQ